MINPGVWLVNTAKYIAGMRAGKYPQSHAAFHFLLDYVPDWELAYGRTGLIQYQSFIPKETAAAAWREILSLSQKRGLPSYLGVTKRHRPDKFLLSHAVDGFSLALDFKVTTGNRARLSSLLQELDQIVLEAGGRFYFAKNSETMPETARRFLGEETVERFKALKNGLTQPTCSNQTSTGGFSAACKNCPPTANARRGLQSEGRVLRFGSPACRAWVV